MTMAAVYLTGILLQLAAGAVALWQLRLTRRRWAWLLIAVSSLLIVWRRGAILSPVLRGEKQLDSAELVTLAVSVTFFAGVLLMGRFFHAVEAANRQLRQQEATTRALLDASPDACMLIDQQGTALAMNAEAARRLQAPAEAILGKDLFAALPADVAASRRAHCETVYRTGQPVTFEDQRQGRSIVSSIMPVRTPDGTVTALAVYGTDVTATRHAAAALAASEAKFRHIVETANEGVWAMDADRRTSYVNGRMAAMLGCVPEQMLGRPVTDFIATEDLAAHAQRMAARQQGENGVYEQRFRHADGHTVWCIVAATALRDNAGAFAGSFAMFTDITASKATSAEREHLLAELARKNAHLEDILRVVSHDLRTPLINILGFCERLDRACQKICEIVAVAHVSPVHSADLQQILDDQAPRALHFVRAGAIRMDSLLNGLLRFSRLGREALEPQVLEVLPLLNAVVAAMRFQSEMAKAQIELVPPLPPCRADKDQFQQVFANLLDNALKYRDPERPLSIRITGRREGAECIYCVEDTGRGIPPEHQASVWDLFRRVCPDSDIPGDGVGLALVHRIIERHQGRAWLESEPGHGSRFSIALPAAA